MQNTIEIYVDGSRCDNNGLLPQTGWGMYIPSLELEQSGKIEGGSVPRAELLAIIRALEYVASQDKGKYIIYSDNRSVTDCFLGYSSRKANGDLWASVYLWIQTIRKSAVEVELKFYARDLRDTRQFYADRADQLAFYAANKLL